MSLDLFLGYSYRGFSESMSPWIYIKSSQKIDPNEFFFSQIANPKNDGKQACLQGFW
jgi:hypothetical protein